MAHLVFFMSKQNNVKVPAGESELGQRYSLTPKKKACCKVRDYFPLELSSSSVIHVPSLFSKDEA